MYNTYTYTYIHIYIHTYIYVYMCVCVCNHENNLPSRLSPQWLYGSSYTCAHLAFVRFEHIYDLYKSYKFHAIMQSSRAIIVLRSKKETKIYQCQIKNILNILLRHINI